MIEKKVHDFSMNRIICNDIRVCQSEPDKESAHVVKEVIRYFSDDGLFAEHPEKNILRCAFISPCSYPYVEGKPGPDDKEYIDYFEHDMIGHDIYRFRVSYEMGGEDIYFVPDVSLGEAMSIAATYRQHTFIYKDVNGCHEICSKPFIGDNGKVYEISDKVQTILNDESLLENEKDLARILVNKTKTWEVEGREFGNKYGPKDEFDFYYISKARPLFRLWNKSPLNRFQYLLYQEIRSENR